MSKRFSATATSVGATLLIGAGASAVPGASGAAVEGCLHDERTRISQALGIVFADQVLARYAEFVDLDAVADGMREQFDRLDLLDPRAPAKVEDGTPDTSSPMSLATAKRLLGEWREETGTVWTRYAEAFAASVPSTQKISSGLVYRRLDDDDARMKFDEACEEERPPSEEAGADEFVDVCYYRERITEEVLCALTPGTDTTATTDDDPFDGSVSWGTFAASDVIDGWAELFELVEDGDGKIAYGEVLEVVVPPALAYGAKGVPGEVEPDETLRFVIRLSRPSKALPGLPAEPVTNGESD